MENRAPGLTSGGRFFGLFFVIFKERESVTHIQSDIGIVRINNIFFVNHEISLF